MGARLRTGKVASEVVALTSETKTREFRGFVFGLWTLGFRALWGSAIVGFGPSGNNGSLRLRES